MNTDGNTRCWINSMLHPGSHKVSPASFTWHELQVELSPPPSWVLVTSHQLLNVSPSSLDTTRLLFSRPISYTSLTQPLVLNKWEEIGEFMEKKSELFVKVKQKLKNGRLVQRASILRSASRFNTLDWLSHNILMDDDDLWDAGCMHRQICSHKFSTCKDVC